MIDEALLDALADGERHSGEALAQRFGISRAALAKRVGQLRALGVEVAAQAGLGYQLVEPWQRLDAEAIQRALSRAARQSGLTVRVISSTDSTNGQLLATDAAQDPQVLFAEHQSAGRGRRGRAWQSPFGVNLYLSLAWTFSAWPPRFTTLPLAVAVALCRALATLGIEAGIKWPNDIQIDGRKLAGILIEPRGETGGSCRVVIGVGINGAMTATQGEGISQPWIGLREALGGQPSPPRNAVAATVVTALAEALAQFAEHGFAPFAPEWRQRDLLAGRAVRLDDAPEVEAVARGIDADGGLLLDTSAGPRTVHAGEVSVRRR